MSNESGVIASLPRGRASAHMERQMPHSLIQEKTVPAGLYSAVMPNSSWHFIPYCASRFLYSSSHNRHQLPLSKCKWGVMQKQRRWRTLAAPIWKLNNRPQCSNFKATTKHIKFSYWSKRIFFPYLCNPDMFFRALQSTHIGIIQGNLRLEQFPCRFGHVRCEPTQVNSANHCS